MSSKEVAEGYTQQVRETLGKLSSLVGAVCFLRLEVLEYLVVEVACFVAQEL